MWWSAGGVVVGFVAGFVVAHLMGRTGRRFDVDWSLSVHALDAYRPGRLESPPPPDADGLQEPHDGPS